MPSEARQKKNMEKLNRAQKCSILGPQNLGSGGARAPLDPHLILHANSALVTSHKLETSYWTKTFTQKIELASSSRKIIVIITGLIFHF